MFLSDLTDKEILSGKSAKGYCRGVGVSLKSHAVKYLLCASAPAATADFSVSTASVTQIGEQITLSKLRPLLPKNCARIFIGRPVYSFDGVYLGKITDLALQDFNATHLFTDQNEAYPMSAVTACNDALLLKREQPYPIGQRIPAPFLCFANDKKDALVTKPVLRTAIKNQSLIKLTLSIAPFSLVDEF